MRKKILYLLLFVLIIIQFIRPTRNISTVTSPNNIATKYAVPDEVQQILKVSCYDCHSNNTNYPWYTNIQPIGWWMQNHVNEGKRELNFSEFTTYPAKKAHHKMEETAEQVEKKEMPLDSYTWIHKDAILSKAQIDVLSGWAKGIMKQIASENNLPETKK